MAQRPEKVGSIVLGCCVLHNYLRKKHPGLGLHLIDREDPETHNIQPGTWRSLEDMTALENLRGNNATQAAKSQRDYLCSYYNSDVGSVPWQEDMI